MTTGSVNALPIDLAPPPLVGSLSSIQNFLGNFAGVLAPVITGYLVASTGSFVGALLTAGGMTLLGAVSYTLILEDLETGRAGLSRSLAGTSGAS